MGVSMWRVPKAIVSLPLRGRSVRMRACTLSLYAILLERIQLTLMSKLLVSFFISHYDGYVSQLFSGRLKLGPNFITGYVAALFSTFQNCTLHFSTALKYNASKGCLLWLCVYCLQKVCSIQMYRIELPFESKMPLMLTVLKKWRDWDFDVLQMCQTHLKLPESLVSVKIHVLSSGIPHSLMVASQS